LDAAFVVDLPKDERMETSPMFKEELVLIAPAKHKPINFEHTEYSGMCAYAQTKTALVLFTVHLDDMLKDRNIRAFAVHPGPVPSTDLFAAGRVGVDPTYKVWFARLSAKIVRFFHVTEILNFIRSQITLVIYIRRCNKVAPQPPMPQ